MENLNFSAIERETDVTDTRNKEPSSLERRLEMFGQDEIPANEITKLLQEMKG